jgi:hypothetical protein
MKAWIKAQEATAIARLQESKQLTTAKQQRIIL